MLLWLAERTVADGSGLQLGDISAAMELDKATTHRLLRSLVRVGFIRQDETTRAYSLGSAALYLAGAARGAHPFLQRCAPIVDRLATELNETVSLSERRGLENVTIYEVESQQVVRYANKIGRSSGLHVAAGAQAVLAWSSVDTIEQILEAPLYRYTEATVTDPEQLRRLIEEAKRVGYTHSFGQRHHGVHSIAVPILDHNGVSAGAASIIWPTRGQAEDDRRMEAWPDLLKSAFSALGTDSGAA